jgi:hypothetical protein
MKRYASPDVVLGLVVILSAVLALVLWVPLDIDTGLTEKVRRRVRIGDAFLPVLGLGTILAGAALTVFGAERDAPTLSRGNLAFLGKLLVCLLASFAIMRWAGPMAVALFADGSGYRALRDTAPWKLIGFITGGTFLVVSLMTLVDGRPTWRGVLIGLAAVLAMIAIYDLPFDDLLLPPNGDV